MKILIRNSDSRVMYEGADLVLGTALRGPGWVDSSFNSTNSHIEDVTLPEHWTGGVWSYVEGAWAIADQAGYDALLAEQAAAAAQEVGRIKEEIKQQIAALEASQLMPRATREFMLLLTESMFPPEQLATNPGYQAVKAFDNQIKALRDQLA